MKHTHLFLLALAAIFLIGCKPESIVPTPITGAEADFKYFASDNNPLKITFASTSTAGLSVYMWDFGDDTFNMGAEQTTKIYKAAGTYTVTLTCKDKNNYPYKCQKQIAVGQSDPGTNPGDDPGTTPGTTPKKTYLKGFRLYNINKDYEQFYIQYEMQGTDLYGNPSLDILTSPQLMLDYLLPITVECDYLIGDYSNTFDWYKNILFTVYCSQDSYTSLAGDIIMVGILNTPSDMNNRAEYIINKDGVKFGLLFEYK